MYKFGVSIGEAEFRNLLCVILVSPSLHFFNQLGIQGQNGNWWPWSMAVLTPFEKFLEHHSLDALVSAFPVSCWIQVSGQ